MRKGALCSNHLTFQKGGQFIVSVSRKDGNYQCSIWCIVKCKGPVKLIKRVKIAHSFYTVSNQFHVIILNLSM